MLCALPLSQSTEQQSIAYAEAASGLVRRSESSSTTGIIIVVLVVAIVGVIILGHCLTCQRTRSKRTVSNGIGNVSSSMPVALNTVDIPANPSVSNGTNMPPFELPPPAYIGNARNVSQNHTRAPKESTKGRIRPSYSIQDYLNETNRRGRSRSGVQGKEASA